MRIAAVAGVGVGDDERPVVDGRGRGALLVAHPGPQVLLIAVGGEQRPDQPGGLVGNLAQRVAGEVGAGILADRSLGRGGPAAEVDPLDAHPFHGHRLARRVGPEGGDALARSEQFAQAGIERLGGLTGHRVVHRDGAALLDHLAGGVDAGDPVETRAVEVLLRRGDVVVERCAGLGIRFDEGHVFTLRPGSGRQPGICRQGARRGRRRSSPHAHAALHQPADL